MKKLITALVIGFITLSANPIKAQISVNFNIGAQPVWGPTGYNHVDYYYLPDIEIYYYVPRRQFVYMDNGRWNFTSSLPSRYSGYNLYNGYKVVMNTPRPYLSFKDHKVKYAKYKAHKGQPSIRYSNNPKYFKNPGHPKYSSPSKGNQSNGNQSNGKEKGGKSKGKH